MGSVGVAVPEGFSLHMAVLAAKPENKFCKNVVIAREQVPSAPHHRRVQADAAQDADGAVVRASRR